MLPICLLVPYNMNNTIASFSLSLNKNRLPTHWINFPLTQISCSLNPCVTCGIAKLSQFFHVSVNWTITVTSLHVHIGSQICPIILGIWVLKKVLINPRAWSRVNWPVFKRNLDSSNRKLWGIISFCLLNLQNLKFTKSQFTESQIN